jgi:PHD/YefM family antitoxin component YafN of YafNO toxin-antitoxin module
MPKVEATMIDIRRGIDSLTNFKRKTPSFLQKLRRTGQPLVLTINGKAKLVVQDAGSYQKLLELVDRLEAIAGIKRGMESFAQGEGRPAKEALEQLQKKHKIARHA